MTLMPLYDRILVKREDVDTKTKSGIILGNESEQSNYAIVVSVGGGYLNADTGETVPLKIEEGQKILIGKWAGDEVTIDKVAHLIIKESEVLAVVQ